MPPASDNLLCFGDNLAMLRAHVRDESVDLVYLDPPFKSNANYNMLFREHDGTPAAAQFKAFEDTWSWDSAASRAFEDTVAAGGRVSAALMALRTLVGDRTDMLAYLAMMAPRLVELRRVLKPTGALYLHCDPTASHYLKLLLDAVFGIANFKNDITWKRTTTKGDYKQGATNWPRVHDVILYYRREERQGGFFAQPFVGYDEDYVKSKYPHTDASGRSYGLWDLTAPGSGSRGHPKYELMGVTRYWRYNKAKMEKLRAEGRVVQPSPGAVPRYVRYLDEMPGVAMGDVWDDIPPINSQAQERLGYPTQKPEALLERIIEASSKPGDVVLDPFCGCGSAVAAAEKLHRKWIGIDITYLAIRLIRKRLKDAHGDEVRYRMEGAPVTLEDAEALSQLDKIAFQVWALEMIGARPGSRGADRGIDGIIERQDLRKTKMHRAIVSVKGGHVQVSHLRDLRGVVAREDADVGVLVTLEQPTKAMKLEAANAGFFESDVGKHARLQILTIAELFAGKQIDFPRVTGTDVTLKPAPKRKGPARAFQQDVFAADPLAGTALSRNRRVEEVASPLKPTRKELRLKSGAAARGRSKRKSR